MKTKFPLLFALPFTLLLFPSCGGGEGGDKTPKTDSIGVEKSDPAVSAAKIRIHQFLTWYLENQQRLNAMPLVKLEKTYRVNFDEVKKYTSDLKASGFFSNGFFPKLERFFLKADSTFRATGQKDGPPAGFEADPITRTQDGNQGVKALMDASWQINLQGDKGTATSGPVGEGPGITLPLVKENDFWKVEPEL